MSRSSIFSFDSVRGLRIRVDPALVAVLLAAFGAEAVLRITGTDAGPRRQGYYPPPHVFDSDCGYRYQESYQGRFVGPDYDAALTLNSAGFHAAEFNREKPHDVYRVALIGDSFLAAISVDAAQTWAAQLPAHLAPVEGKRVEVLNFGVDGYLPWNMARLLESEVLDYSPDAVILWVDPDRLRNPRMRYRAATNHGTILEGCDEAVILKATELENRRACPVSEFLADHSRLARVLCGLAGKVPATNIRPVESAADADAEALAAGDAPADEAAFRHLVDVCRKTSIPLGVVYRERCPDEAGDLARALGVPATCDARSVGSYAGLRWPNDPHFSIEGNADYARLAAPTFDRLLGDLSQTQLTSSRD